MAIAPTGNIFKALSFDNVSSRTYGVYITGEAVYNAPEREVEMISIPGRNGAFALDRGRFENVEVTYPAGIFAETEADFREAISEFRNFLCSRKGYVRLQDEYNPNEYRMAVYKSGLEVEPAMLKAGQFNIVFDCKPQRYLTDGETAVSVDDGDTLTNPTLFEAHPLLEVEGYGAISFNGFNINIANAVLGKVTVLNGDAKPRQDNSVNIASPLYNTGDAITVEQSEAIVDVFSSLNYSTYVIFPNGYGVIFDSQRKKLGVSAYVMLSKMDIVAGTDSSKTDTVSYTVKYANRNSQQTELTTTLSVSVTRTYDASTDTITWSHTYSGSLFNMSEVEKYGCGDVSAYSSISILGHPTYIDCDLGEAYKYEDGVFVSLNRHIDLGSKLPTLAAGSNEITYDNTITDLQIVPRWWRV